MRDRAKDQRTAIVQDWNRRNPVGTAVRFWTGTREGQGKTGLTTSVAYLLSGHTPVVLIDTASGCVALTHVEPLAKRHETQSRPPAVCPKCRLGDEVSRRHGGDYYCHRCRMEFDSDPDEGGDYDDRDPSRRLEREEARKARSDQQQQRRR